ncbi:hypothetical protein M0R45_027729 [Rubus argutus]|uniref:BZIP domain-containing protein n=1 Tax=Rubus argutus TaxID=59490 RepID=A0AAW1X2V6_RUBAR
MSSVQRQASSGSDGSAVDDKKRKKMLSNRESARRSRMKKQKHVEELTVEISRLQMSNNQIQQSIDCQGQSLQRESIEQTIVEFSGVFDENFGNMAEMHHDSLLNPWQLPYSTQPITASSADMFLDWP